MNPARYPTNAHRRHCPLQTRYVNFVHFFLTSVYLGFRVPLERRLRPLVPPAVSRQFHNPESPMHKRKPPPESVFVRAAQARAAGSGWEAVAKLVGRSAHTVRKWPHAYPDRWAAALRTAERTAIDSAAAESVLILRDLLRSEDDKVRVQAAWRLVYQRLEQHKIELKAAAQRPPEPPSDAHRLADFVRNHTHEQLCEIAVNVLRTRLPRSREFGALPAPGAA